jgi:CelD/BcsL family acetyltransferase involved in cellulose biosynthesis
MLAGEWQKFKVAYVSAQDAADLMSSWNHLAAAALEPAGFNAPQLILPILKHVGGAEIATVTNGADLLLALPLHRKRTHLASWITPLTASGLPHVRAESAVQAFLQAQTQPVQLQAIPSDGSFLAALKKQSAHFAVLESWQRAALKPVGIFEDWLQSNFDQKRRKEFKRLRNRLAEQGALVTEVLKAGDNPKPFVDDFLRLEAGGWKGKKGTAINASPNLVKSLHEAAIGLHLAGKLRFWNLKLAGKSIATLFVIVENNQAWLGKIAYDETHAKYSPGALIILDCTESFFNEPHIKQIDSSAIPNHPLIDRIWRDRLPMVTVLAASSNVSALRFKMILATVKLKMKSRALLRDLFYKIKGGTRS